MPPVIVNVALSEVPELRPVSVMIDGVIVIVPVPEPAPPVIVITAETVAPAESKAVIVADACVHVDGMVTLIVEPVHVFTPTVL